MAKQQDKKPSTRDRKQERVDTIDGRVWTHRINAAKEVRKKALEKGDQIRRMVTGRATEVLKEDMEGYGDDWIMADWNKMAALVRVMIPALLHTEPDITVLPWDELDEVSTAKADLYTYLVRRFIRTNNRMEHSKAALFEAIIYGKGCTFTDFNKEEQQPRTRFQTIKEVYIDPAYDGTPNTMQWVARDLVLPVDVAKKRWPKKAHLLKADTSDMSEDEAVVVDKDNDIPKQRLKQHITLCEVWIDGHSTEYPDMKMGQEGVSNHSDESNEHTGYHGKREVVTLLIESKDKGYGKIIDRRPWGVTLNENEFPFQFLELTNDPNKVYGESILNPARRLQETMNVMLSAITTRQLQSAKDLILIKRDAFEDADAAKKALEAGDQLTVLEVKNSTVSKDAVTQQSLGVPNAAQIEILQGANRAFEDITGYAELTSGDVRKAQNATAAQFSEERRQSSIANAVLAVERWQADMSRVELMFAQSLMTYDAVKEVVPPRLLGEVKTDLNEEGEEVETSPYWNDAMTPREIRNEAVCHIRAGSMRFMSVEERRDALVEMQRVYQEGLAIVTNLGYEVPREAVVAVFRMMDYLARLAGVPEFKDLKVDSEMLVPIEDEAAKQEEVQQQAMQAQQQLAQALPQMIQQAVAPMLAQFGEAMMQKVVEALQLAQRPAVQQAAPAVNPLEAMMGGMNAVGIR